MSPHSSISTACFPALPTSYARRDSWLFWVTVKGWIFLTGRSPVGTWGSTVVDWVVLAAVFFFVCLEKFRERQDRGASLKRHHSCTSQARAGSPLRHRTRRRSLLLPCVTARAPPPTPLALPPQSRARKDNASRRSAASWADGKGEILSLVKHSFDDGLPTQSSLLVFSTFYPQPLILTSSD